MRRTFAILQQQSRLNWLDVRAATLSVLERLLLEECLLKSDTTNSHWMIVGHHATGPHQHLMTDDDDDGGDDDNYSKPCIVMGIGGKPARLLNLEKVRRDQIMTIKRFTGGGTVVVDPNCLWTTIIGRKGKIKANDSNFLHLENKNSTSLLQMELVDAFPRPIMEWTADAIFAPLFQQLNDKQQQDSPVFQLLENDYVLVSSDDDLERKMGGNAQAIVREGWLHHTSFLWTFDHSMGYLQLPAKRPEYRADRDHADFLVQLQSIYRDLNQDDFYDCLQSVCKERFNLQEVGYEHAMHMVEQAGGMRAVYEKSRTRVLTEL